MKNQVVYIQYMPNKRQGGFRIKKFELCDSNGYILHISLYARKDFDVRHAPPQYSLQTPYHVPPQHSLRKPYHAPPEHSLPTPHHAPPQRSLFLMQSLHQRVALERGKGIQNIGNVQND
ncbi:hypothetical protein PoB_002747500 [Plakobranchus ocellatus]|uniref:Uncharacterized protein n=1 Tax=Plakobranchus ocellatus TaxID=259542 RepID=A0AAV3ZYN0_9GAST|nr:hypothetical protein PoB_002747500 [Plakobranchus ocellatus]